VSELQNVSMKKTYNHKTLIRRND